MWQVGAAGLPRTLLSEAAAGNTLEELERALRTEKGFSVVFTDVVPAVNLHRILYQWEGQFVLNGPFPNGEASARFTTPEVAKEVRQQQALPMHAHAETSFAHRSHFFPCRG